MEEILITGGRRLEGGIRVQGSKNSALPILAAAAAAEGVSVLHNCPNLTDVNATFQILRYLGCTVNREGDTVSVDTGGIRRWDIPEALMHEMRSSIVFLGPLLSRFGQAEVSTPGGCEIGQRPIDLHLRAMEQFGVAVREENGRLYCSASGRLRGETISLALPSVGATENAMLAAATAQGTTTILNAAREPEISDLAGFLNRCGAKIRGAGEGTVVVEGVEKLKGSEHRVIPDRIMAATFMAAAAVTGGSICLNDVIPAHVSPVCSSFEDTGCEIAATENSLRLTAPRELRRFKTVRTMPYPGFPTDAQAAVMAMACVAKGTSMIVENIFDSRFKHAAELRRLGAEIEIEGRMAVIEGVSRLRGAPVTAPDLRGGTALVIAGLAAEGLTRVSAVQLIDRGCQAFENSLRALGADVKREREHASIESAN